MTSTAHKPPYLPPITLNTHILNVVAKISELVGRMSALSEKALSPKLRRINRIRSIQASLAIENNTLSIDEVTAVLDGKMVIALPREIQEVHNAFATYEKMDSFKPYSRTDLLKAHALLMAGLVEEPGCFRHGGVGVYRGKTLVHMAPPASRVPHLIDQLLDWLKKTDLHPLIASSIFHYEFEFIHPFPDGNGRMGRLWQTLILAKWQAQFAYLPIENLILKNQQAYYKALGASNEASSSTPFVEFILTIIHDTLKAELLQNKAEGSPKSSLESSPKTEDRILGILQKDPLLSTEKIAKILGISKRAVLKQIAKLKTQGRLNRIGASKGGRWQVIF